MSKHRLIGQLYGGDIYEPPCEENEQLVINLNKVSTMRTCLVCSGYGRLERCGIVFQLIDEKEVQANYCSEKQAESEFNELKHVLAKL